MRRISVLLSLVVFAITLFLAENKVYAAWQWVNDGSCWLYANLDKEGDIINQKEGVIATIGGKKYAFEDYGCMVVGLETLNDSSESIVYAFSVAEAGADLEGVLATNRWIHHDGDWYYFDSYGRAIKDQCRQLPSSSNGKKETYCFDEDGIMKTENNSDIDDDDRYYDKNGAVIKSDWVEIDGDWYYFDSKGKKITNVCPKNISVGKYTGYYCFDENGVMVADDEMEGTGNNTSKTYIIDSNGKIVSYIKNGSDKEWNFSGGYSTSSGATAASGFDIGGVTTLNENNKWLKKGNDWYYIKNGKQLIATWSEIEGKWYYFGSNGVMVANKWEKIDGKWYLFDENGERKTGWQQDKDGVWYYLDKVNGYMRTNECIEGYYVGVEGNWTTSQDSTCQATSSNTNASGVGGVTVKDDSVIFNNKGTIVGDYEVYDPINNVFTFHNKEEIDCYEQYYPESKKFDYFCKNTKGQQYTGWVNLNGEWRYFNSKYDIEKDSSLTLGAQRVGWLLRDGYWYYYDDDFAMAKDKIVSWKDPATNKWSQYYLTKDGSMATGPKVYNINDKYFCIAKAGNITNSSTNINGIISAYLAPTIDHGFCDINGNVVTDENVLKILEAAKARQEGMGD